MYTEKNCVKNIGMFLVKGAYLLCTAFVLKKTAQILHEAGAYSEHYRTSKMERFVKVKVFSQNAPS